MGFDFAGTCTKIVKYKLIEYSFGDRAAKVEHTPGSAGFAICTIFNFHVVSTVASYCASSTLDASV
jgi:hypothetical protein